MGMGQRKAPGGGNPTGDHMAHGGTHDTSNDHGRAPAAVTRRRQSTGRLRAASDVVPAGRVELVGGQRLVHTWPAGLPVHTRACGAAVRGTGGRDKR